MTEHAHTCAIQVLEILQIFTVIWVYFLRGWKAVPSVLWRVSGGSCVIVRRLEFLPSGLTPQFALSINWEQLSWNLLPCWNVSVTLTSVFMHITSLVHAFGEGGRVSSSVDMVPLGRVRGAVLLVPQGSGQRMQSQRGAHSSGAGPVSSGAHFFHKRKQTLLGWILRTEHCCLLEVGIYV